VATIMTEFDRHVSHNGATVVERPPFRLYTYGRKTWRLLWLRGRAASAAEPATGDTVLAETPLSAEMRDVFRQGRVHWLDLGGRTRSRDGSPLTEELALYLGRYGVRLARDA
jgi:hypothetical protein